MKPEGSQPLLPINMGEPPAAPTSGSATEPSPDPMHPVVEAMHDKRQTTREADEESKTETSEAEEGASSQSEDEETEAELPEPQTI